MEQTFLAGFAVVRIQDEYVLMVALEDDQVVAITDDAVSLYVRADDLDEGHPPVWSMPRPLAEVPR